MKSTNSAQSIDWLTTRGFVEEKLAAALKDGNNHAINRRKMTSFIRKNAPFFLCV